jgi:hypothetical protein
VSLLYRMQEAGTHPGLEIEQGAVLTYRPALAVDEKSIAIWEEYADKKVCAVLELELKLNGSERLWTRTWLAQPSGNCWLS